jgi:hypothetical protein
MAQADRVFHQLRHMAVKASVPALAEMQEAYYPHGIGLISVPGTGTERRVILTPRVWWYPAFQTVPPPQEESEAMIRLPSEADISCSAERIFDLIVDFRGQDRWLGRSSAFRGTVDISANPVTLGTTYREPGPFGVRNGTVTELERPTKITFHQPMSMILRLGIIDVLLRYTLSPQGASTHVHRVVTLNIPWSLRLLQPVVVRQFRTESTRTLLALKAYADQLP